MRLMTVCLEYAHWHGGKLYMSGQQLTLDESSALWLIGKGLAEAVEAEPDTGSESNADAQIAGDAPQSDTAHQPEPAPRRARGKANPTTALPESGDDAPPHASLSMKESEQ